MGLKEIVDLSNKYGRDPEFVLAGGGNSSYKEGNNLYVKASGTSMASIDESGFVRMDRERLKLLRGKNYGDDIWEAERQVLSDVMAARGAEEFLKRPSVEVLLHDLFPQKYVLHVHPAMVNGATCGLNGEGAVMDLFHGRAVWISAIKPGYTLASYARAVIDEYTMKHGCAPDALFIQNHGAFFAAETTEKLDEIIDDVMGKIKNKVKREPDFSAAEFDKARAAAIAPAIRMLVKSSYTPIVTFRTNREIKRLVTKDTELFMNVSTFTPDHIVYCMHQPLFIKYYEDIDKQYEAILEGIREYASKNGQNPKIIGVENLGYFACGAQKKDADIAADVFMDAVKVLVYSESFGGPKFMDSDDVSFIRNWEVESYRKKVSLSGRIQKRAAEKIVIVTGAAQGFGKGISEGLALNGANVIIADLNEEGAKETARELEAAYGKGKSMAVKVDVTDEDSVNNMVMDTVLEYGGLDALISNAGILKAGSLEEMDIKSFELVNKINYTGFLICTKYGSRPMKVQHRFDREYFMDIIQINSKSGLSGSNKNFAYAGSKFGGIGLTQSFALELVEYNIKVNAVCPGNYFEGPLWSDPEKGLFVQYLRAGKVPGAKNIEDVKKAYESKVPMGRGCMPDDVVKAILYIMEQQYETGQAVPVTGGQQMLK